MRHVAWLNTGPRDKAGKAQATRLEKIKKDGKTPTYPPLTLCPHLASYLFDAGPSMPGAMGNVPLPHSEIKAWQDNTGIELSAWEASTLRRLSSDYLASAQAAEKPTCKPPFVQSVDAKQLIDTEFEQNLDLFLK